MMQDPAAAKAYRADPRDKTVRVYDGVRHDIFNEPRHEEVCADMSDWMKARVPERVL
jgi:alpha-beta hydrolase superfamily lysophospholipase